MRGVFSYANPPVIRWGVGSVRELGAEVTRLGGHRPAVVSTRSVAGNDAIMDPLAAAMANPAVAMVLVAQHTPIAQVERATREVAEAGADLVVSVGGGSAVDAAKLIAGDLSLPHVAVPTTLSVAELASGAGFTDEAGNKVGRREARMLPHAVIYDGALALATPMDLWLSTGIRALDHAVEGFLADGEHPLSDVLCLEAVRRLFETLPRARAEPEIASIRTENQLAAWFSFTLPGPTAGGLSHTMGKQIGARYGIPHGVTSCLLLPHVMRYRASRTPERLAALSAATGVGPHEVWDLIRRLGLPQHIAGYGIGGAELQAAAAARAGHHAERDLLDVYMAAL